MRTVTGLAAAALLYTGAAVAGDGYLNFNADGELVVSGPFSVVIPAPDAARTAGPASKQLMYLGESLQVSRAGFFGDDEFVVFEIETTDAPAGTLSYDNLPVIELAGREFHTRAFCIQVAQDDLEQDQDSVLEFIEQQRFALVPAVFTRQLFVTTDDGTAEGVIIYARRIDDCDAVDSEFEASFDQRFESFIASVRAANE